MIIQANKRCAHVLILESWFKLPLSFLSSPTACIKERVQSCFPSSSVFYSWLHTFGHKLTRSSDACLHESGRHLYTLFFGIIFKEGKEIIVTFPELQLAIVIRDELTWKHLTEVSPDGDFRTFVHVEILLRSNRPLAV